MPMFRKKPVEVEAQQFMDGSMLDLLRWIAKHNGVAMGKTSGVIHISTLEGIMEASPGDWIIRGVKGEFYPCKPDIFEATYEKVEE